MNNFCIGIVGNDFKKTNDFVEKIILNTNAKIDQEHMKMNIIINNNILENNNILNIVSTLEKIDTTHICLCFNDKNIYELVKKNTNIPLINNEFDNISDTLVKQIVEIYNERRGIK